MPDADHRLPGSRSAHAATPKARLPQASPGHPRGTSPGPMFAASVATMPSASSRRASRGSGSRCRAAYKVTMLEA